jgi:hypothetical protein
MKADCGCAQNPPLENHQAPQSIDAFPQAATELSWMDIFGRWMARWGISRMRRPVNPGLYRVGNPDNNSPVFVTANYSMTFDLVRAALAGIDAYMLVLDTKGINVWCAAGKGTFGTGELVRRMALVKLGAVVRHRRLILPQLGAPGISAHEVKRLSGFQVIYGPVYIKDIRRFLELKMKATPDMRRVRFSLADRLALIPMELVPALKFVPAIFLITFLLNLLKRTGWNLQFIPDAFPYLGAIFLGSVIFQILLPWLPTRSFAVKAAALGLFGALALNCIFHADGWDAAANLTIVPAITAYLGLNFTGSTTFTSLSGVKKELRIAVPAIIVCIIAGIAFKIISFN